MSEKTDLKKVEKVDLVELTEKQSGDRVDISNPLDLVKDVKVKIQPFLGETEISIGELFDLKENALLKLDMPTQAPIDLKLNGKIVARGNLVVIDENFGIQITEIIGI